MGASSSTRRRPARYYIVAALTLAAVLPGRATADAPPNARFARITPSDGLSQVTIQAIMQDSTGFVWVGTQDGLNRYDGRKMLVLRTDPADTTSLSDSNVIGLHEAHDGSIWVITALEGGLNRYDPRSGHFTRFVHRSDDAGSIPPARFVPTAVCELGDGTMWFGTRAHGIVVISPAGDVHRLVHDPADPASLASDQILTFTRDRAGTVWVGTLDAGLDRWAPAGPRAQNRFDHFPIEPAATADGPPAVTQVFEDHTGTLWVGTAQSGLLILDRASDRLYPFPAPGSSTAPAEPPVVRLGTNLMVEDDAGALWVATQRGLARIDPARDGLRLYDPASAPPGTVPQRDITALAVDREGTLWVGSRSGVYRRLTGADTFCRFVHDPRDPSSLVENRALTLFVDRGGVVWIGSESAGLSLYSRFRNQFGHYLPRPDDPDSLSDRTVYALLVDSAGTLWVGTAAGGLNRFDAAGERVIERYGNLPGSPRDIGGNWVRTVLEDSRGRFWVGALGGGLSLVDRRRSRVIRRYTHRPDDPTSLSHNDVVDIFEDSHGRIWVSTSNGWNLFNPDAGTFTSYLHDPDDPASLVDSATRFTYEDRDGALWIGTVAGLSRFDPDTRTFTSLTRDISTPDSLSHNNVMAMLQTPDGAYWIATFGGGLDRWERSSGAFTHFTSRTGFPSDALYTVIADDQGFLWVSSNHGLIRLDPTSGETHLYDAEDGLQANEFDGRSAFKAADGTLYFGGINGFNRFKPTELEHSEWVPPVVLVDFRTDGASPNLPRTVPSLHGVRLSYTIRHFAFEFAALDFDRPRKVRFAYMLEGFDTGWIDAGGQPDARYTAVPAGRYTFLVKAANPDGVWNREGAALEMVVVPPPWRSPWAYAGYIIALLGGVAGYVRYKTNAHREEMDHRRKTEELERARSIQLSMLPEAPPRVPGLEIAVHMETATEVGGDYYDFFPQSDGSLYAVTGDATGHGLAAGMMVGMTKAALRALEVAPPSALLARLDGVFRTVDVQRLRMALNILWIKGSEVRLSSAGMPPVFVYRNASGGVSEVLVGGLPLGGTAEPEYRQQTLQLQAGDALVLISDGLPEWLDETGELLGYEAVRRAIGAHGHLPPDGLVRELLALGVTHGGGEPHRDDVTIVVMKWTTSATM